MSDSTDSTNGGRAQSGTSSTQALKEVRKRLYGISARTWEHPADRATLTALKKVPGLDTVLQKLVGVTTEKSLRLITLASSIRVNERQFPKLHQLHREACAILDLPVPPELYVSQSPFLNAGAVGVERPFIVLNSSLVDSLSEEEMLCVIGHELGHCMSGHVLYKTLLNLLIRISTISMSIPLGGASVLAIIMALREWDRKSELSADRAGLLVVQNPEVAYRLEMKFAGATRPAEIDINEFFIQAAEYESGGGVLDSFHKMLNLAGQTHPFPVLRLTELKQWVDGGAYSSILRGEYKTRDSEAAEDVLQNIRDAANKYKDDFNNSQDPLAETLRNAMANAGVAKDKAKEAFDAMFKNKQAE